MSSARRQPPPAIRFTLHWDWESKGRYEVWEDNVHDSVQRQQNVARLWTDLAEFEPEQVVNLCNIQSNAHPAPARIVSRPVDTQICSHLMSSHQWQAPVHATWTCI